MDPVSQGVLGAAAAQSVARRLRQPDSSSASQPNGNPLLLAAVLGAAGGMAPDLDVFIQSADDPLLFLEFHRHFTHSLLFIPIGALIVALPGAWLLRNRLSFASCYLACLFGYATHGLLDACTSYGTQLLWPFSSERVAWNNIAVVDPLFTLPATSLMLLAILQRTRTWAVCALLWMMSYLMMGAVQRDRALAAGEELAASRGHQPSRLEVKPSFANLLLWKLVYEQDGRYYVEALRTGIEVTHIPGDQVAKLDLSLHLPWLDPGRTRNVTG